MATAKEKQLVRLLNNAQRGYNTLMQSEGPQPALLHHFREELKSLIEAFECIEPSDSALYRKLNKDIRDFFHDSFDECFFIGYKGVYAYTTEEHYTIDAILEMIDVFCYVYEVGEEIKPHPKPYKTVQDTKERPKVLTTTKAEEILVAAEKAGLCSKEKDNTYRWDNSLALLVYFIVRANRELDIPTKNGGENWKIWEPIFNVDSATLRRTKATDKSKFGGKLPRNSEEVDNAYSWTKKVEVY